jgi:hypothetical protein
MAQCPLAFQTCHFEEGVDLSQATTTDLSFTSCALSCLAGDEFNSSASLRLEKTHLGQMSFGRAEFRGFVGLAEVRLINPEGRALNGDGMSASGIYLIDTHVEGEVRLAGANISGQLHCSDGTKLINPEGRALNAFSMSARDVILYDTHVEGEVRLAGANISGQLHCTNGTKLINPIPGGTALEAEGCHVGSVFSFHLGEAAVGTVNLAYAQIGTLYDDLGSWPDIYNLVGFSYDSLVDHDPTRRLEWISDSKPFSPHIYTQLAEVYRRSGHEGLARRVAIEREKERGQQPDLSWWVRAWNGFLGLTVAYGYQPWRALLGLVVLFLLGWLAFSLPAAQQVMVHAPHNITGPISATACHKNYPCFFPAVYALDTLLPIVDLHQESNWVPASHRPWGVWYEVLTWVLIAAGWILTTAVVAGIGSLWRR